MADGMHFGIFSNGQRHIPDVAGSWELDLAELVTAERVGLDEAWVSEHTGSPFLPDALPAPEMLICAAAGLTERIRFGSGVRRIALYPPVQVAMEAAVCQHLTRGRYVFGFGAGGPASGFEQRGLDLREGHARMQEAIELILRCWRETTPFDHAGQYYSGRNINVYPKPMRGDSLPVAVATTRPDHIELAAQRGFRLLTSQFARPATVRRIADVFETACARADRAGARADVTAVRAVYVAETDERALREVAPGWREHLEYNKRYFGPALHEYVPPGGTIADITFEHLLEQGLVFVGSPDTVAERLAGFHAETGGFGTFLMVAGKNWASREQRDNSFQLFCEQVKPRLAARLGEASIRVAPAANEGGVIPVPCRSRVAS